MENINRCRILFDNYKKAIVNLKNRIDIYNTEPNDVYKEIIKESIAQCNEISIELAWKTARSLVNEIEPNIKIPGSSTAFKQAFKAGIISNEDTMRKLLSAVQHRNLSSHEYLLNASIDDYINKIISEYLPAYLELLDDYEKIVGDM